MHLHRRICDVLERDLRQDPVAIYRLSKHELCRSALASSNPAYFGTAWGALAPTGNIYRYNAIVAERRKHSEDLWLQLGELADEFRHLIEGETQVLTKEERTEILCEALAKAEAVRCLEAFGANADLEAAAIAALDPESVEDATASKYHVFGEFLGEQVVRYAPFLAPKFRSGWYQYVTASLGGIFSLFVQILAPTLFVVTWWPTFTVRSRAVEWLLLSFCPPRPLQLPSRALRRRPHSALHLRDPSIRR